MLPADWNFWWKYCFYFSNLTTDWWSFTAPRSSCFREETDARCRSKQTDVDWVWFSETRNRFCRGYFMVITIFCVRCMCKSDLLNSCHSNFSCCYYVCVSEPLSLSGLGGQALMRSRKKREENCFAFAKQEYFFLKFRRCKLLYYLLTSSLTQSGGLWHNADPAVSPSLTHPV